MTVLPPQSKTLIPEKFEKLYDEKLQSISPVDFILIPPEGTDKTYKTKALIPPVNVKLIDTVLDINNDEIPSRYMNQEKLIIMKKIKTEKNKKYEILQKNLM